MLQPTSWANGPYYQTGAKKPWIIKFFKNGVEVGDKTFDNESECRSFQQAHNKSYLN